MSIAQIYAILALLLAFGVPQNTVNTVQDILQKANPSVQLSIPSLTPQVDTTVAGSVPVQACTDNPSLSLYVSSSTPNSVFVMGQYTAGCNLDVNTKWVFKTDLWNVTGAKRDYNYGIIGHANEWDLQGAEGEQTYNIGYFRANINPYVGQKTATLTVGGLTATTTISQ